MNVYGLSGLDLCPIVCDHPPCNAEPLCIVLVTNERQPLTVMVSVCCPFHVQARVGHLVRRLEDDLTGLVPRSRAVIESIAPGVPISVQRVGGWWALVKPV